uniref:NlpC/P60 family protein n=1 Tax=Microbulbifer agarilyticus TaxID=260552 RepID=UPI000255B805|nr:NlpC/P60 family protein [Microbulbifer agarilyticus]
MKRRLLLPYSLAILTTAGCSLAPYQQSAEDPANSAEDLSTEHPQTAKPPPQPPSPSELIKASLYDQHREWKGIPYRLGGMSKRGIDCSALVYLIYRDHMGVELPRTTQYQATAGAPIKRTQLRPGDLVFFRTGRRGRHVGIYLEDGKFLHASVSRGVTISQLTDHYWKSRYWRARRLELTSDGES